MSKDPEEEALKEFLLDINCLDELKKWGNSFNIFDVLKISKTEIRHSNMLAWLLNPNGNHGLGDIFVKQLFQCFVKNTVFSDKDTMNLLLMDFYSFSVVREQNNIDILMVSNKEQVVIVFENKVGTGEHDNQLQRYKKILDEEYPDYKKFLIYLTPEGDEPSDPDWEILTYGEISDILEDICQKNTISQEVLFTIKNYIDIIRRDVMEDKELIEICNKIYAKHKKALDLINEYKMDQSPIVSTIKEVLKQMAEEGILIPENSKSNKYIRFYTPKMNQFLPDIPDANGSWGNEHPYAYEFNIRGDVFGLSFVLAGKNVPIETKQKMTKIMLIECPKKADIEFQWKHMHFKKYSFNEENDDTDRLASEIKKAIKYQLDWENKILAEVS